MSAITASKSDFEVRARWKLAAVAERVPAWRQSLRELGFDAQLVEDDWIATKCSAAAVEEYEEYQHHFWREVLLCGEPSKIVFSEEQCASEFLTKLKHVRFERYGKSAELAARPESRHLVELVEAMRMRSRVNERMTEDDIHQFAWRQHEAAKRIRASQRRYAYEITSLRDRMPTGVRALTPFCIKELMCALSDTREEVEEDEIIQRGETFQSLRIWAGVDCHLYVFLVPEFAGESKSMRLAWRVVSALPSDSRPSQVVVHLSEVLPFGRYHHFDSVEQLAFNLIAHKALVRIIVPDLISALSASSAN